MIYFLIIFICSISSIFSNIANNKIYKNILLFAIVFVLSTGYMCGTDWRNYELMYYDFNNWSDFLDYSLHIEPLYVLINIIGNKLNLDFWIFFIILKFSIGIVLIKSLESNSSCNNQVFFISLLVFISFFGFFMLIDNPMRNVIAVAISLQAIPSLFMGNFKRYVILVLIAVLFHFSALFMLILYPITRINISNKIWFLLYIIVNLIILYPDYLFRVFSYVFSFSSFISNKIDFYYYYLDTIAIGKVFSLGLLIHFVFFILILKSRNKIEKIPNGKYIFNLAILFPIVFRFGLTSLVFSRFQLYLAVFYSIAIGLIIYSFSNRFRIAYKVYVVLVCFCASYSALTADYRYIPYTNYFFEKMFGYDLSYEMRSNYNKNLSPYKDKNIFEK